MQGAEQYKSAGSRLAVARYLHTSKARLGLPGLILNNSEDGGDFDHRPPEFRQEGGQHVGGLERRTIPVFVRPAKKVGGISTVRKNRARKSRDLLRERGTERAEAVRRQQESVPSGHGRSESIDAAKTTEAT